MRKTRVRKIKQYLWWLRVRSLSSKPITSRDIRTAKRVWVASRAGRPFATNRDDLR